MTRTSRTRRPLGRIVRRIRTRFSAGGWPRPVEARSLKPLSR